MCQFLVKKVEKELNETPQLFDLVIKTLRLFKASAIYRDKAISSETLTFQPHSGVSSRFPFKDTTTIGDKCQVSKDDVGEIKELFILLKKTKSKRFTIAVNRINFAIEKDGSSDKIIDYMIGLEALYLPSIRMELGTQLALRIAFMHEDDSGKRKSLYKFIKDMYALRGGIVHGEKHSINEKEVIRLEAILRESIKMRLYKPEKFHSDYLSNIYFEAGN